MVANAARMPYAVFAGDRLVGMTAWLRPDVSAQTIEIGSSYIHPDVRGTGLNGRMKRLMLGHAFAVGIRRVEFRIDERNARSQAARSEEHTSELQSLMRISYAVFCLKHKNKQHQQ